MTNNYIKVVIVVLLTLLWQMSHANETVKLTQTGCQFIEPESVDNQFITNHAEDCKAVNTKTSATRLANSKTLHLKPGMYTFRVLNKNVPYTLGFWLRGEGLGRLTLPSVSGGGIETGQSRDYSIKLTEGKYLYSCPLNPTPNYTLIVAN